MKYKKTCHKKRSNRKKRRTRKYYGGFPSNEETRIHIGTLIKFIDEYKEKHQASPELQNAAAAIDFVSSNSSSDIKNQKQNIDKYNENIKKLETEKQNLENEKQKLETEKQDLEDAINTLNGKLKQNNKIKNKEITKIKIIKEGINKKETEIEEKIKTKEEEILIENNKINKETKKKTLEDFKTNKSLNLVKTTIAKEVSKQVTIGNPNDIQELLKLFSKSFEKPIAIEHQELLENTRNSIKENLKKTAELVKALKEYYLESIQFIQSMFTNYIQRSKKKIFPNISNLMMIQKFREDIQNFYKKNEDKINVILRTMPNPEIEKIFFEFNRFILVLKDETEYFELEHATNEGQDKFKRIENFAKSAKSDNIEYENETYNIDHVINTNKKEIGNEVKYYDEVNRRRIKEKVLDILNNLCKLIDETLWQEETREIDIKSIIAKIDIWFKQVIPQLSLADLYIELYLFINDNKGDYEMSLGSAGKEIDNFMAILGVAPAIQLESNNSLKKYTDIKMEFYRSITDPNNVSKPIISTKIHYDEGTNMYDIFNIESIGVDNFMQTLKMHLELSQLTEDEIAKNDHLKKRKQYIEKIFKKIYQKTVNLEEIIPRAKQLAEANPIQNN
jgi:hypothetical protein